MWEQLLGSTIAPAVQAGVGEAATQAIVPAVTDATINAGLDQALTAGLSNVGAGLGGEVVNPALGSFAPLGTQMLTNPATGASTLANATSGLGQGMFSSLGNFGNAMMSDQGANVFKGLGGVYNAYNQGRALDQAKNIQNAQLAQSQDAYARDKSADERRQKLVF